MWRFGDGGGANEVERQDKFQLPEMRHWKVNLVHPEISKINCTAYELFSVEINKAIIYYSPI